MALCMGCMAEIGNDAVCPFCGFKNGEEQSSPFLPYSTVIGGRYVVGKIIEHNGESTTYIGYDRVQSKEVRIREFLPDKYFIRDVDGITVEPLPEKREKYEELCQEFKEYFIKLSDLVDHTCMPRIHNILEENNTCYIIENHEHLVTLEEYVKENGGYLEWDEARLFFMPLVTLLEAFHMIGIGHYGISPANIYVTKNNRLKVYGFATENERKQGTALKAQLYSGFSAPEQYITGEKLTVQTDIYGLCATLFYVLAGTVPESARKRIVDGKLMLETSIVRRIPPHVIAAMANGLQIGRSKRTLDFDCFRNQVSASSAVKDIQEKISKTSTLTKIECESEDSEKKSGSGGAAILISAIATAVILSVVLFVFFFDDLISGVRRGDVMLNTRNTVATEYYISNSESSTEQGEIHLDNFVGMDYQSAVELANSAGVTLFKSSEPVYNDNVPAGEIISQYPVQGTVIDAGSKDIAVYVEVSSGSLMRELPEIENLTEEEAAKMLSQSGLLASAKRVEDSEVKSGIVIGYENYKAFDMIEVGSTVTIVVAQ